MINELCVKKNVLRTEFESYILFVDSIDESPRRELLQLLPSWLPTW